MNKRQQVYTKKKSLIYEYIFFLYFQISLGRMAIDILKFLTLYLLVLFAFACGMNQLLWYYADLEYEKCYSLPGGQQNLQGEVKYGKHGKVVKLRPYCMHCIFHIRYSLFCKDFRLENLYYIFWRLYIFYADWWMMLILNLYFHLHRLWGMVFVEFPGLANNGGFQLEFVSISQVI